ncbi:hypothetical protein DRJ17_01115 [Candidatus Woesearchaeota archaeon]|nr:MAG: hypothetical protein DRJ17_01115 [Candidatus Woesearchaeota archaeon]
MIRVKKLGGGKNIYDLKLGELYIAWFEKGKLFLNKNVLVRLKSREQPTKDTPVMVKKIIPPNIVEAEKINDEYEIIEEPIEFINLSFDNAGETITVICRIDDIYQTSGPTSFTLFDGTSTLRASAFSGAGKRAFPELKKDDIISARLLLKKREDYLESELVSFKKIQNKDVFIKKLDSLIEKKSQPDKVDFLIKSETLEKLKPRILTIAKEIKRAIVEERPIILRHHADCDGYSGAIALERAIIPLIIEHHKDERAQWFYYKRAPTKAPYYDYSDVTKDLTFSLQETAKKNYKEPLIILVDNGSTEEDLLGIRKVKIFGAKIVVIDHHFTFIENGRSIVDNYLDAHVNPYLVGGDKNITAGMIATEIARFINRKVSNIYFIPALAGFGDRSRGNDFEQYVELAMKAGYDKDFLKALSEAIDFEAHYLKFIESRGLMDDIFGADRDRQHKLVKLMKDEIESKRAQQLETIKHFIRVEDLGRFVLAKMEIEKLTHAGDFPSVGKATGLTHDYLVRKYKKDVLTLSIACNFITVRATEGVGINVNIIIHELKQKIPYGFISGGGHENAGSIRFVEAVRDEVLKFVEEKVKNWKVKN